MPTKADVKLLKMIAAMIKDYEREIQLEMLDKDTQLQRYQRDIKRAMDEKKFFTAKIIQEQYRHHKEDLQFRFVASKMHQFANNGKFGKYMEPEDRAKYEDLRLMSLVIYDVIDSVTKDFQDFFTSIGLGTIDIKIFKSLQEAREDIQSWCAFGEDFDKETLNEETDRIYETLNKRLAILKRKSEKAIHRNK